MSERIEKLQPNRTLNLRGFDALGASAALHHATASSFEVSGVFRDPADFCVLMLHDADDFFEHPTIRYLPDTNFAGLTLAFDVHYSGLHPLDSPRYHTIDWPFLDVIRYDPNPDPLHPLVPVQIALFNHAQQVGGTYTAASAQFTVAASTPQDGDTLRLWYLNTMFEYAVKSACSYAFAAHGAGTVHTITIGGTGYSYTELAGETEYSISQHLADAVNASAWVSAVRTYGQVDITARVTDGRSIVVSCSDSTATYSISGASAASAASALAASIASVNWGGVDMPITATASGAVITVTAVKPGADGNAITIYAVASSGRLTTTAPSVSLSGGVSDATWRVTLDFTALGIEQIRQMWLTFAPPVSIGQAFTDTEWIATFTNWTVTGDPTRRALQVAGPGSTRIDSGSPSCVYTGTWSTESGFFNRGYAQRCTAENDKVTVTYDCSRTHDLYIGTSLYTDRGQIGVRLDGGAESTKTSYLYTDTAVVTRLKLLSNVAAGHHTVTLRAIGGFFCFDFLEAAVASDVPQSPAARTNISPALDYSTDHTYKLSPARLMWNFDHLAMNGPIDQYLGVFWWNQRHRVGAVIPSVVVTFAGTFAPGDQIFLNIGGLIVGRTVFAGETNALFASQFAWFINAVSVGAWAAASGNALTITAHSPTAAYAFDFTPTVEPATSTGTVTYTGSLKGGVEGSWMVDPAQSPVLNRGARDWHADFYQECASRTREVTTAVSMELVNPPPGFAAQFSNGSPVITSVGFGSLNSTHCGFNSNTRGYQEQVFDQLCSLQAAAGLVPHIQFGEFCWWYFASGGSMAFYDAETAADAQTALGRPLHVFAAATDDPQANSADALFLRNRLRDHVSTLAAAIRAQHPTAQFEVLFPYDVNYPTVVGVHSLGGPLLRFINFPAEWSQPSTAGYDTLKMEALDFGSSTRSLTLAREAIEFPLQQGWPKSKVRYLLPVFNGGCPWLQESRLASGLGIPFINLWAFDHVCIFNLQLGVPGRMARSMRFF